jgi:hypothetical protein
MIATVPQNSAWWANIHPGVAAFDVIAVALLGFGYWRGRRNGMSKELLPLLQWLVLVSACTLGYSLLAGMLVQWGVIRNVFGNNFKESTAAAVSAYLIIAFFVFLVFAQLKASLREKVQGNNAFGNSEYYLGMMSGVLRYACMIIFFLALLNAPVYSLADIHNRQEFNNRWFGGGLQGYSGDFIPSIDEIQSGVFKNSLLGPVIKNNLSMLLINPDTSGMQQATAQKKPVIRIGN